MIKMLHSLKDGKNPIKVVQNRFAWSCLVLQIIFASTFALLTRYGHSADAKYLQNQLNQQPELKENLEKYSMVLDVHIMIFGGFGLLMTFLKFYGLSSVGFTLLIFTITVEWATLLFGFIKLEHQSFVIHITFLELLEASLASACVLISFGAVLGKLNPLQILIMALIEGAVYIFNWYIGYTILGAQDPGGAIFIHVFGAYFGLSVSLISGYEKSVGNSIEKLSSSRISDLYAIIGTLILWVYWPSFNGILVNNDGAHRAYINTFISLVASTVSTFTASAFFHKEKKFSMIHVQNASLAGGVAVGAVADMMLQPFGALVVGSLAGLVSTLGFHYWEPYLSKKIRLHDTCGVHFLHGIPGVLSAIISFIFCFIASEDIYGSSLYLMLPRCAPLETTEKYKILQKELNTIQPGEGRSVTTQAIYQLVALGITLLMAIVSGIGTGYIIKIKGVFEPLQDTQYFDDVHFWILNEDDEECCENKKCQQHGQIASSTTNIDDDGKYSLQSEDSYYNDDLEKAKVSVVTRIKRRGDGGGSNQQQFDVMPTPSGEWDEKRKPKQRVIANNS